nr:hypothetical protein 3 [Gammaproteobacteria bacterium]
MDLRNYLAVIKRIAVVAFGSFAAMVAMTIIVMVVFTMFASAQQADNFIFGEYGGYVRMLMFAVAYPVLWRYMKVGPKQ